MTGYIINDMLSLALQALDQILPYFGLDEEFYTGLDQAMVLIIDLLNGAAYFLNLDALVICFTAIFVAKNYSLMFRVIMKVIGWVTP